MFSFSGVSGAKVRNPRPTNCANAPQESDPQVYLYHKTASCASLFCFFIRFYVQWSNIGNTAGIGETPLDPGLFSSRDGSCDHVRYPPACAFTLDGLWTWGERIRRCSDTQTRCIGPLRLISLIASILSGPAPGFYIACLPFPASPCITSARSGGIAPETCPSGP